jgi:hypothetical protein
MGSGVLIGPLATIIQQIHRLQMEMASRYKVLLQMYLINNLDRWQAVVLQLEDWGADIP